LTTLGTADVRRIEVAERPAPWFDLSMTMVAHEDGRTSVRLGFPLDLFEEPTIVGLLDRYLRILTVVANEPGSRIAEITRAAGFAPATDLRRRSASRVADLMCGLPEGWTAAVRPDTGESPPPGTPTEVVIAEVWRDLLDREPLGVLDDFFALGGHSLLVPQLVYRIEARLEVRLAASVVFEQPTVRGLAEAVDTLRWLRVDAVIPDGYEGGVV
jgi:Phosphopantetheine attachment site